MTDQFFILFILIILVCVHLPVPCLSLLPYYHRKNIHYSEGLVFRLGCHFWGYF